MNLDVDVIIIGSGPIGSTVADCLLKENLKVAIIEKKKQIGYPLQCAGIISTHIHELNTLPEGVIINKINGAYLHSNNHILKVEKQDNVAYVIDRIAYDMYLHNRAVNNGAILINHKAINVDINNAIVILDDNSLISGKIIVGCEGYNSIVSKAMGNSQNNYNASQFLVEINNIENYRKNNINNQNYVDTYLKQDILPGFIWIIPTKDNTYRVGLFSKESHKKQNDVLIEFLDENFSYEIKEKYKGFIPIFNDDACIVKSKAILIGDAAAQIKPTSGGGLLIGFDACKIASKHIIQAIRKDNYEILENYQKEFNKKYLKEINYQYKVQKTLNILNDEDIDYLFNKLKINNCEEIISQYGDMDKQSILIKEFIKRGLILKIIPSFFIKKVSKIFGF